MEQNNKILTLSNLNKDHAIVYICSYIRSRLGSNKNFVQQEDE
jgi:hypothetical protein